MIILDADLEEETIRAAVERWLQLIESRGAERGHVDWWGKRRLAYEISIASGGLLRGLPGPVRARRRWTSCTGCSPLQTKSSATRCCASRRRSTDLRRSRAPRRRAHREETMATTRTPSPSSATSPAIPRCGTRRAASRRSRFGVAVNRSWRNQQTKEWEERTSFFNIVVLASARRERRRVARRRASASSSPAGSSSAAGRPSRARSDRSSRSSPTTSRPSLRVRDRRGAPGRAQRSGRRRRRSRRAATAAAPAGRRRRATRLRASTAKSRSDGATTRTSEQEGRRRRKTAGRSRRRRRSSRPRASSGSTTRT